jgi:AcrR family transcriptional regulator
MDTDEQILDAASRLLARFGGFTMDRLASEAAISRAALLRRFPRKSKLLARLERERQARPSRRALATRERILLGARRFVARRGLVAATVEAIASEAGVDPATVLRVFGDRQSLVQEAMAELLPSEDAWARLRSHDSAVEVLGPLASAAIRFTTEYAGMTALMLAPSSGEAAELERLLDVEGSVWSALSAYLASRVEAGELGAGDPEELTATFVGIVLGASIVNRHQPRLDDAGYRHQAERLVRKFLRAAKATTKDEAESH